MLCSLRNSPVPPHLFRRLAPHLAQGISVMALESPFYGPRRPEAQRGSKLRVVSDLLTLGWATIFESICLLHKMQFEQGFERTCET